MDAVEATPQDESVERHAHRHRSWLFLKILIWLYASFGGVMLVTDRTSVRQVLHGIKIPRLQVYAAMAALSLFYGFFIFKGGYLFRCTRVIVLGPGRLTLASNALWLILQALLVTAVAACFVAAI